jgi:hypothetical protein
MVALVVRPLLELDPLILVLPTSVIFLVRLVSCSKHFSVSYTYIRERPLVEEATLVIMPHSRDMQAYAQVAGALALGVAGLYILLKLARKGLHRLFPRYNSVAETCIAPTE